MPSTITDRLNGLTTSVAVKAPVRVATTAPITASGLQTIDAVSVVAGDRVLRKDEADAVDNGIFIAASGAWRRAADFDGSFDVVGGTQVFVIGGSVNGPAYWRVAGEGALHPSVDDLEFEAITGPVTLASDLNSAASGKGASLVKLTTGETVETAIQLLKDDALSIAEVCSRGSTTGIKAANKTAFEALLATALAADKAILIPSGDWYIDPGSQILTGLVSIICDGTVYTSTTGPFVTMKAVGGGSAKWEDFSIRGGKFVNTNGTQAQKSSSIIKFQSDGAFILSPNFLGVEGYGFYQMFDDDCGTYTTGFGEESLMNHGIVDGCLPHYYGALNAKYCFLRRTGSGTGWIYRNIRDDLAVGVASSYLDPAGTELLGHPAYVRIESGGIDALANDMFIDGQLSGKHSALISIDGECDYRGANISVSPATQIDAQADRAVMFDPMLAVVPAINMTIIPSNIGGNVDIAADMPRCVGSRFHAQGFGEAQGGRYEEANLLNGAQSITICDVWMQSGHGCEVELWASGIVNGVNQGLKKQVFSVVHNGTIAVVTEVTGLKITDPASPGSGFWAFTGSVSTDLVTFSLTYTATSAGSTVAAQYRVTGGAVRVRRLFG